MNRQHDTGKVYTRNDLSPGTYECEYLVIGSGAGGGLSGHLLAEAGKDVIILEEGGYHTRNSFTPEVASMTNRLYRNGGAFPFLGSPAVGFAEGRCVGGSTVINGALFWRTPPPILEEWQKEHGLNDLTQESLQPHFEQIEKDLNVSVHELENDANLDSKKVWEGAKALGWKVVLCPRAIKDCINENWCATGCLHGGKQSVLETYVPRAVRNGARIFSDLKADRIRHSNGQATEVEAQIQGKKGKVRVAFDHLIIAAGAIHTPALLQKSGLSKKAGRELQFHLNLKSVALHKDPIYPEIGTIFTTQVQEFEKEGLLIMASNTKPHYLAMTLAHFNNDTIDHVVERSDHSSIYVGMIRPESKGTIYTRTGSDPIVKYSFNKNDLPRIQNAIRRTCELLFATDVEEIFLPISGSSPIRDMTEAEEAIKGMRPGDAQMISVHAMASCPMGADPKNSVVDPQGYLWGMNNIMITDASILPSNMGESPQGTIQAISRKVVTEHLENKKVRDQ